MYINFEVPINKDRQNDNIKTHILDDSKMRELGFTDYNNHYWLYSSIVYEDCGGISFGLVIKKDNSEYNISVLDEQWLQTYDYQHMFKHGLANNEVVETVHNNVQNCMKFLMENGIITGYKENDYI